MSQQDDYIFRMGPAFGYSELIDVPAIVSSVEEKWVNQTLCRVNDMVVRLAMIEGEFHWHKHDEEDEFFYVVDGKLLIDEEEATTELTPKQGYTIEKGVVHRTRAPEPTVVLLVEGMGVKPAGDD